MVKFRVSESKVIDASLKDVFGTVKDFNTWKEWSPWSVLEPEAQRTVEMTEDGVGSFQYWNGEITGEGTIEHVKIEEGKTIDQEISFLKPYKSNDKVWWEFEEVEGGVKVTWNMLGSLPFFMFFMKKKMAAWIGMDYQRGLGMLDAYVRLGKVPAEVKFDGMVDVAPQKLMGMTLECSIEDIPKSMSSAFQDLMSRDMEMSGPPLALYFKYDMVNQKCKYMAAAPVKEFVEMEGLEKMEVEALKCMKSTLKGSYMFLGNAWASNMMRIRPMKAKPHKKYVGWEVYVDDPRETKPENIRTEVYVPVR